MPLKDEGKAENMLLEKESVTKMKVTGFCYALMVQRREGEDMTIFAETTKALEEKKDMFVVQKIYIFHADNSVDDNKEMVE